MHDDEAVGIHLVEDVEGGSSLSDAMSKQPKAFDTLYCKMVAAGEIGGVLDVILQRLAEFMEKAERLKRKVVGALIYPAAVILVAVGIVAGIMFLDLDNPSRRKIQLMRDWFTSPQYKVVRETKMRQKRTPSDIIKIGK